MFRGHRTAYHPFGVISAIKLNCDGGKYVPLDLDTEDLLYLLMLTQNKLTYRISDHLKNGDTFYSYLEELEDVSLNPEDTADCVAGYFNYEYGSKTVSIYVAGSASTSCRNIGAHVHGYCPFGYLHVPFGDGYDPNTWFPAPSFAGIRFEATGAVASGDCALCLIQDRPY